MPGIAPGPALSLKVRREAWVKVDWIMEYRSCGTKFSFGEIGF